MTNIARIKRKLTDEESKQSEADAISKLSRAYQGMIEDTDTEAGGNGDEVIAFRKIQTAMARILAD